MHARITVVVLALMALALPAMGAQSYLGGYSGLILSPDTLLTPAKTWDLAFHDILEVLSDDDDVVSISATYGLLPSFEIGASFLNDDQSDVAFSGKYEVFPETESRPAVAVGVFDLFSMAEWISNDPSFYIVVGKNITEVASEAVNEPSKPLYLNAGVGSGVFSGFFAGLNWTLTSRLQLQAEFLNEGLSENSQFNAGIRYAASDAVRLDVGTIDFEDFGFGISLRTRL